MLTRRRLIRGAAVLAISPPFKAAGSEQAAGAPIAAASRVRPRDAGWPSASEWEGLRRNVEGQLIAVQSPLDSCRADPEGDACGALFKELKNPYFIGDSPALTQTCGWIDAWTAQPSVYAVAAQKTAHVVAAVNFAREKNLRLVVKGGGHSYLGASNAADSLMVWTRAMNDITVHDAFVPAGCAASQAPQPAVTMGAGAIWMRAYGAVTTGAGRYVQGGGCGTVGVAGLVQGGGFGSYSKQFGTAGASLLEAEIVTADGVVRIANACNEPDLFWALKGGGAGSFGVVTRLTLKTWDLPDAFGVVATTIRAKSDEAYRRLLSEFVAFYAEQLFNRHWGELAKLLPDNRLEIAMNFQGLDKAQAAAIWGPFLDWAGSQDDLAATPAAIVAGPGRHRWDGPALEAFAPGSVLFDDRPGAPAANFFWSANLAEAGHFIHGFESLWTPATLLEPARREALADALMAASRHWAVELHFQKGLAGAPPEVVAAARDTPINPAATASFMLAIIAGEGPPAFPGLAGHEPNLAAARRDAARIERAAAELRKAAPDGGAYVAESSYFQADWQQAYWGANYPRLLAVKQRYDPDNLFFVRRGVGSEGWSEDGFAQVSGR
jgi:FAD/FMN-containing dehydrogenase